MAKIRFENAEQIRHAYIVVAPSAEDGWQEALCIAQAAVCQGRSPLPCGKCNACRKVLAGLHPDVSVIERLTTDAGKKKREVVVDQVRVAAADAVILPNEASRKVYLFKDAEFMNPEAQNAALKFLEEPPNGAVLVLCVSNPGRLLPTVRSRCVEVTVTAEIEAEASDMAVLAEEYLKKVAAGDRLSLWQFCEENAGISFQEMTEFCLCAEQCVTEMLCSRADSMGMEKQQLHSLVELMEKCIDYLRVNVNVKQVFGLLETGSILAGKQKRSKN